LPDAEAAMTLFILAADANIASHYFSSPLRFRRLIYSLLYYYFAAIAFRCSHYSPPLHLMPLPRFAISPLSFILRAATPPPARFHYDAAAASRFFAIFIAILPIIRSPLFYYLFSAMP